MKQVLKFRPMRLFKKVVKSAGTAPGTLVQKTPPAETNISVLDYTEKKLEEKTIQDIADCFKYKKTKTVSWIDIDGTTPDIVEKIGQEYGLHPLLMEDLLDVEQRPKFEEYDTCIFVVVKMLNYTDEHLGVEQVSIVFGKNYVLTFQERPGDVFDPVRERIRLGETRRIRKLGSDYLAYALIDVIVDTYYEVLEQLGERLEVVEEELLDNPSPATLHTIQGMKRDLLFLRKSVWPLREVLNQLYRAENKLIKDDTKLFLRDVYDHTIQVVDTIETFRDMVGGLYDTYLSSVNNKMSEVMKVLTIIATIFIPLTFLAGIYGMNFDTTHPWNMPELGWAYGYAVFWVIIVVLTILMVLFFKRKNWL